MKRNVCFSLVILSLLLCCNCSEKQGQPPSGSIKITGLKATLNPVRAYDTTIITVEATGDNLQYGWVANHGKIQGSGKTVKYSACVSCMGLNTITCRVFNQTGEVSDTIMIRVVKLLSR